MLGVPGSLKTEIRGDDLLIHVPRIEPDQVPCLYAYTFKIPGAQFVQ
jgi:hypothetical protein